MSGDIQAVRTLWRIGSRNMKRVGRYVTWTLNTRIVVGLWNVPRPTPPSRSLPIKGRAQGDSTHRTNACLGMCDVACLIFGHVLSNRGERGGPSRGNISWSPIVW